MTSHPLDPKNRSKRWGAIRCSPSSWQFVEASSVFLLRAQCPLKLKSRLETHWSQIKEKKKKKRTKSRKLCAHRQPTINYDHRSYMCRISSVTFVSNLPRDRDRGNSKNRWIKPNTNGMLHSYIPASSSIFQIIFPETSCHAKTRLPDQRLWQPARPYLLIINRHTRSILPILPSPIFKNMAKQAYQHIHSTILTHNTRAQKPTLGKASRDASDTRAWHTTRTL